MWLLVWRHCTSTSKQTAEKRIFAWESWNSEWLSWKQRHMLSMDFLSHPAFWICVAAASELIALSPLKSNSIIQLVFQILTLLKAKKG